MNARSLPLALNRVGSLGAPLVGRVGSNRYLALVAAAPVLLLVFRLLPPEGPGLALRMAAAAACVLLVPGALLLRVLGWPASPGVAAAGALALSLVVVFVALGLTFAVAGSLTLTLFLVTVAALAAIVPAVLTTPVAVERTDLRAALGVLVAAVPLAALTWWAAGPLQGDAFFHLGRTRKLDELDAFSSLTVVNEFRDGSPHSGYAFPLWHGAMALVGRLAGVDTTEVVLYLPALLVPLALLLAYGAGVAVFRSWAGGAALVVAQAAQLAFGRRGDQSGTGSLELITHAPTMGRVLLAPAILALAFTFAVSGGWGTLAALGAASLALSVIHPTYTPYVALLLGAFVVARLVLVRCREPLLARMGVALAAVLAPFGLYLIWLFPIVRADASHEPTAARRAFELAHYGNAFDMFGDSFRFAPEAIARGGPVVVAGLLAVPLAGLAARRLWAALVLGGSLAILAILLLPQLFTLLSDSASLSQSRRLAAFLPIAFALAGAALLLGRLRLAGVALAGAAGLAAELLVSGEFTYRVVEGGPGWVVWVAALGGLIALVAGAVLRRAGPDPGRWAVFAALAFAVPIAASGVAGAERGEYPDAFTPGLIEAVRDAAEPKDVVFADLGPAYQIAAYAPVYVNAAPTGHVPATPQNRPKRRRADAWRFFLNRSVSDSERREILARYDADWLLVDKARRRPASFLADLDLVYEDGRYVLYDVRSLR